MGAPRRSDRARPRDARTGTIHAARACGIADEEGVIAPHRRANLVAIDGALDETFAALRNPAFVMNRGKILKALV